MERVTLRGPGVRNSSASGRKIGSERRLTTMSAEQINRLSSRVLVVLSLVALFTVISGYFQPPHPDEGAAHIFQLSIVALVPTILIFLLTADWKQRWQAAQPLAISGTALVAAFAALYYLEHYWYAMK